MNEINKDVKGTPEKNGAAETGGIVDQHRNKGPHVVKYNVDTQDNQGTANPQENDFGEVGRGLQGLKDSPLDKK